MLVPPSLTLAASATDAGALEEIVVTELQRIAGRRRCGCWIDRGVDLSGGPRILAAVAPVPFNYEIGADTAKIRVGNTGTAEGELLTVQQLPRLPGRPDRCLRFARPRLDPQWALDWVEIGE